jgi:molybdopterin synthase catalytic subunit
MNFRLTGAAINPSALMAGLRGTRAGACVTFEGRVRGRNEGKAVRALDYEAYSPLAEKEGKRILAEAREKFQVRGAVCVHRTGSLELGDIAVWVAVAAEHRGPAFEACRYIINETKARVPIWKKERYTDGVSEWINCAAGAGRPGSGVCRARRGKGAKSGRVAGSASSRHK